MLKILVILFWTISLVGCNGKPSPPPTAPRSELSNQYLDCVMKEREQIYKTGKVKSDQDVIQQVQNICNSKVLKINSKN